MEESKDHNPETLDQDNQPEKERRPVVRILLLGLLAVIILGALGALGGYLTALSDRQQNQASIISTEVSDQLLLGLIAYEHGQFEVARQHFEYILKIDPGNKAAAGKLTETLLKLGESNELPTSAPTLTVTPTPDTRNQEELYNAALSYRDQQNWSALLDTLDTLRVKDPNFNPVQVDGMYYLAYRNRGMHRIQVEGNLEGGIFDLNRAEIFGYLDAQAANYRTWAARYITGLSFWGVDWQEVINYFSPLAISAPNLSDSNYFTAQDRLATAQVEINFESLNKARIRYQQKDWCEAYDLFNQASAVIQLEAPDLQRFEDAKNKCFGIAPTSEGEEETPEATTAPEETATPEPTTTP